MYKKRYWLIGGAISVIFAITLKTLLVYSLYAGKDSNIINIVRNFNFYFFGLVPTFIYYVFYPIVVKFQVVKFQNLYLIIQILYWFLLGSVLGILYSRIRNNDKTNN